MQINLKKLDKQLYYHPQWPNDRRILYKFIYQEKFTDKDILACGRLYVKYSHLHRLKTNEFNKYFNFILHKMQIHSEKQLFKKTKEIYQKL